MKKLGSVATLPLRVFATSLRLLHRTRRTLTGPRLLPVAGIDEGEAQTVLSALRQGAENNEERQVSVQWLCALALSQVAADRLHRSVSKVDASVAFWRARLSSGRHRTFMLLGQGPLRFMEQVLRALRLHAPLRLTATAELEAKLAALHALREALLRALARVHEGASALLLRTQPMGNDGSSHAPVLVRLATLPASQLHVRARGAVVEASNAVVEAVHDLHRVCSALEEGNVATPKRLSQPQQQGQLQQPQAAACPASTSANDADGDKAVAALSRAEAALLLPQCSSSAAASADAWSDSGRQLLGKFCGEEVAAAEALTHASVAAAAAPPLARPPSWAAAPSRYQQHWLRYSLAGAAAAYSALFVYRHSRLSGSDDMERWARVCLTAIKNALRDNIEQPLLALQGELFRTFRERPAIVTLEEFETDRMALRRMLEDFRGDMGGARAMADAGSSGTSASSSSSSSAAEGMSFVMGVYERELKSPIRSLLAGNLARSLLIQVQALKVDSQSAMLELDQILRANELSIAVVAATPALLVAWMALRVLRTALTPTPPDPGVEVLPARMAAVEMQRALSHLTMHESSATLRGTYVYSLGRLYTACWHLFGRHRLLHRESSEWRQLQQDLLELAGPLPPAHLADVSARMLRSYTMFRQ